MKMLNQIKEIDPLFKALEDGCEIRGIFAAGIYIIEFIKKNNIFSFGQNGNFSCALSEACLKFNNKVPVSNQYIDNEILNKLSSHIKEGFSFSIYMESYHFHVELHKLPHSKNDYEVKKHGMDIVLDQAIIKSFRATEEFFLNLA